MKKIIVISALLGYAIFLLSCGGGSNSTSTTTVSISSCDSTENIDAYTAMQANDTIVQDQSPVTINRYFNEDGTQTICTLSGTAHLERG